MSNIVDNGEYIFKTTDPFGREVQLKSGTWYKHVIDDNGRTELAEEVDTVKKVIEDPYYILKNSHLDTSTTRQKYLDIVDMQAFKSLMNLVVIIEDYKPGFADVVTIIAKKRLEKTEGGILYVRGGSTNK